MAGVSRDRSLGDGVYFAPEDYLSFCRRLVITLVDVTMLLLLWIPIGVIFTFVSYNYVFTPDLVWYFCCWCYLAVLRPSRVRSVGYWVT